MEHPHQGDGLAQLVASLGHDLRTPVNAILGYCELLGEELVDAGLERLREDVRRVQACGAHLAAMMEALVDLARLEQGQAQVTPSAVALGRVVDEALASLGPPEQVGGPRIEIQDGAVGSVAVDPVRLRRALVSAARVIADRAGERRVRASIARRPEGAAISIEAAGDSDAAPARLVREADGGLLMARALCARIGVSVTVEAEGRIVFTIPPNDRASPGAAAIG
ncbi:MAG: HAMP domain-containing histidine kinase [Polyangiaceae bacterium]|nr:HAMP domain-containing histidine kinase [Polyangiaceae bacterium]